MTEPEPCLNCGELGCDSECLLIGTGAPGRDHRRVAQALTAAQRGLLAVTGEHHVKRDDEEEGSEQLAK